MMRRNMLQMYGGNQHFMPVEGPVHDGMFAPVPFEGNMPYNQFGGGKQPFPQPFNPMPFEGGMGGQKGVPWWMSGGPLGQTPQNLGMPIGQGMPQFGFPMRNNLMGFGMRR